MGTALQMTWQLKSLKRKQPPLGLRNLGNSCYLNSVLQCLTYTPPLANFCLRFLHSSNCDLGAGKENKGECPFCLLEKRIARSLSSEAVSDAPLKINSCLRIYAEHFRSGRQEDAHEFLRYVIDACHNTCLRLKKLQQQHKGKNGVVNGGDLTGTGETVVKEIFGGAFQSQVKCLSCGAESNKVDEIMDISLDILHNGSLKESFQKFFQPEVLDGNNKYKCSNCKELVAARKQMSILQAPNVLVIQLKRFEGIFGGKVDKHIAFDEILELSTYMCKASQDHHPQYNLFGTIVHSGFSPDSGHYYAYIKDAIGRWYCCNDSYVSISTLQEVLSEKVYILFFSRTKQRPRTRTDVGVNGSKSHESNGSKPLTAQKSGCLVKSFSARQASSHQSQTNNSPKSLESNGARLAVQKLGCLEKPIKMKVSVNHSGSSKSTDHLASNGTRTPIIERSDRFETPPSNHKFSENQPETFESATSYGSDTINSSRAQKSSALVKAVNIKVSANHYIETKAAACKREPGEENGVTAVSVAPVEKEKTNITVNESNGRSKRSAHVQIMETEPSLVGVSNGQNGHIAIDSLERSLPEVNGAKITSASHKNFDHENFLNNEIMASNSGMKRKIEDKHSCILLAGDDQSRAKVEAFKELIGKEASTILRSSGWADEVQNFMHARKKAYQEAGGGASNDHDRKSLLISLAKRNFIGKVPELLKARLIERLRLFSHEKQ